VDLKNGDMSLFWIPLVTLTTLIAMVAVSYLVEAQRPVPPPPEKLTWAPSIPILYADIRGIRIRYIKTGAGPKLVLLHTLRTQLDLFEKVVPDLANHFTVYALDYPGHGYSDIPRVQYNAEFFVRSVEGFLDAVDLRGATLCGVSIGASIALIVAGRGNARVSRVVAINPYDYAQGRGMARSSPLGWMIVTTARIPVVGETVMRLRNFAIMKAVLRGGVADPTSIPPDMLREMYDVGNRRDHYRAFLSLLRNAASWQAATAAYPNIRVPVTLIWGDKDWARAGEREHDRSLIPGAQVATVETGGHFLPLDRPKELRQLINQFAGN
jgi:pimeloyl-ACP methyl ester carboxylesterase